jgi:hypothetical protein
MSDLGQNIGFTWTIIIYTFTIIDRIGLKVKSSNNLETRIIFKKAKLMRIFIFCIKNRINKIKETFTWVLDDLAYLFHHIFFTT